MPGLKGNTNWCEGIARDLISFAESGVFRCPDVVETDDHLFLEENSETASWLDYFSGVYDIEYRIAADTETLNGIKLRVATGGPDIFIDKGDARVKLYWHGGYAEAYIPYDISEQITEYFEELYYC